MSFIEGLGKGQMISRQGLTSPYLGDIQLSLCDRRGNLEVEIIRARNLVAKSSKIQPREYLAAKCGKKCLPKSSFLIGQDKNLPTKLNDIIPPPYLNQSPTLNFTW